MLASVPLRPDKVQFIIDIALGHALVTTQAPTCSHIRSNAIKLHTVIGRNRNRHPVAAALRQRTCNHHIAVIQIHIARTSPATIEGIIRQMVLKTSKTNVVNHNNRFMIHAVAGTKLYCIRRRRDLALKCNAIIRASIPLAHQIGNVKCKRRANARISRNDRNINIMFAKARLVIPSDRLRRPIPQNFLNIHRNCSRSLLRVQRHAEVRLRHHIARQEERQIREFQKAAALAIAGILADAQPCLRIALHGIRRAAGNKVVLHCAGVLLRLDQRINDNRIHRILEEIFITIQHHLNLTVFLNQIGFYSADVPFSIAHKGSRQNKCNFGRVTFRISNNRAFFLLNKLHILRIHFKHKPMLCLRVLHHDVILKHHALHTANHIDVRQDFLIMQLGFHMREIRAACIFIARVTAVFANRFCFNMLILILDVPGNLLPLFIADTDQRCFARLLGKFHRQYIGLIAQNRFALFIPGFFKSIVNFLPLAFRILEVNGFRINDRLICAPPKIKRLTVMSTLLRYFFAGHELTFHLRAAPQKIMRSLFHVFFHIDFLSSYF